MMKTVSSLTLVSALFVLAGPSAHALSAQQVKQCNAMGKSLQVRQAEAKTKATARATLVEKVETAGEAWEDVEILRRASPSHAAAADEAKGQYEALKADLMRLEMALQSLVGQLNEDVSAYNKLCVTD